MSRIAMLACCLALLIFTAGAAEDPVQDFCPDNTPADAPHVCVRFVLEDAAGKQTPMPVNERGTEVTWQRANDFPTIFNVRKNVIRFPLGEKHDGPILVGDSEYTLHTRTHRGAVTIPPVEKGKTVDLVAVLKPIPPSTRPTTQGARPSGDKP